MMTPRVSCAAACPPAGGGAAPFSDSAMIPSTLRKGASLAWITWRHNAALGQLGGALALSPANAYVVLSNPLAPRRRPVEMGDGYQIIDILLFAAIAGFLVLRLRSVLGRRTGLEQRRDPFTPPPAAPQIVPPPVSPPRAANGSAAPPLAAPSGIAAIAAGDPSFAEESFLRGARGAFEIIVNAFAAGDTAALKPLLSKDVFDRFAEAIEARRAANETLQTTLVSIKSAEIFEATVEGGTALVTVKFVSDQTNVTRTGDAKIVEGEADRVVEHVDFWTFARPVKARDPNWTLVATHSP
jgi:predicted lipid-binding transport protein (Tim44 family)